MRREDRVLLRALGGRQRVATRRSVRRSAAARGIGRWCPGRGRHARPGLRRKPRIATSRTTPRPVAPPPMTRTSHSMGGVRLSPPPPSRRCVVTAFFQWRYSASRCSGSISGDQRLSSTQFSRRSSCSAQKPDRQAGRVGRAQRGRLGHRGPDDGHAEEVGLELHEQVVRAPCRRRPSAAASGHAGVGLHRLDAPRGSGRRWPPAPRGRCGRG